MRIERGYAMKHAIRDTRGSTAIEFALVMPVLLLFRGGIIDFGRAFYYRTELDQSLRSGMQYALKAPMEGRWARLTRCTVSPPVEN